MERGNTKHGPRLDEQMQHEVQGTVQGKADTRAEEWHHPEPSGEDQPAVTRAPSGFERAGAPPGMTPKEVEQRSRLGRYIPMASLPGDRDELLAGAKSLDAPDDILSQLNRLPEGERYQTVNQVWAALGHHNEERRT